MNKRVCCIIGASLVTVLGLFTVFGSWTAMGYPQTMRVSGGNVCRIRSGAGEAFDVVGLISGEEQVVALELSKDENDRTWYRIDKSSLPDDMDISAEECYIRSDLLIRN